MTIRILKSGTYWMTPYNGTWLAQVQNEQGNLDRVALKVRSFYRDAFGKLAILPFQWADGFHVEFVQPWRRFLVWVAFRFFRAGKRWNLTHRLPSRAW